MREDHSILEALRSSVAAILLALLAACGGGGDSQDGHPSATDAATGTDQWPTGTKIDLRHKRYFPAQVGDTWHYRAHDYPDTPVPGPGAPPTPGVGLVRSVIQAEADRFTIETTGDPEGADAEHYRRGADGLYRTDALGHDAPTAVRKALGELMAYPDPFFAVREAREHIREGEIGEDLDGDGRNDRFRLQLTQALSGFETVVLADDRIEDAARFDTTTTLTIHYSLPMAILATLREVRREWFAPGLGLVKAEIHSVLSAPGMTRPEENLRTLLLERATIGGVDYSGRPIDGRSTILELPHADLVHAPAQGRYYASIPASAGAQANRIAVIDAASGQLVSTTRTIGQDPTTMAVAADGGSLYVGLRGSGEVVRLRLPDFVELSRSRLAAEGQSALQAVEIVASPTDPAVAAVGLMSLDWHGSWPDGFALLHDGVRLPRTTLGQGRSVRVAFAADGASLVGYAPDDGGRLRRIRIEADGLVEDASAVQSGPPLIVSPIDGVGSRLLVGNLLFDRWTLQPLGQLATHRSSTPLSAGYTFCRGLAEGDLIGCIPSTNFSTDPWQPAAEQRLQIFDATTLALLEAPAFSWTTEPRTFGALVPGGEGQVAIRIRNDEAPGTDRILFHSRPAR